MSPVPLLVTVDANLLDEHMIAELIASTTGATVEFATVTVNQRERGGGFGLCVVPETAVWGESPWDGAVWGGPIPELMVLDETALDSGVLASEADVDVLERVMRIVSNGSFPKLGARDKLTDPQRSQLRDAMSFEAHVRHRRNVYVSNDKKAFITYGRREALEALSGTRIFNSAEFIALGPEGLGDLLRSIRPAPDRFDGTY